MNGQQLKNSILQMAIQGKLVPQDPNDEPASVLIQHIREEKEKLIKDKKIKKEKNSSYIFRSSDNLHYEKIGDAEPVCIEEQLPFEIPNSWEWVRLGDIGETNIGLTYHPTDKTNSGGVLVLRSNNIKNGKMNYDDCLFVSCKVPSKALICKGDILICARNGSRSLVGKCAIVDKDGMAFGAFMAKFSSRFNPYITIFLDSPVFRYQLEGVKTETINQITQEMLKNQLLPLPPLSEQERIVGKIEELIPHIDEYDAKESKINELNSTFPEQLKKSILQEAVQGKLVPQDPLDEPASVLLERIRDEKARLVKEGKIKKDKNESVIFRRDNSYYEKSNGVERCIDKELPFEIPNSWEWTRFKNIIIDDKGGGTPDKSNSKYWGGTIPWMSVKDFSKAKNGIIIDTIDHITQEGVNCSSTNVIDSEAIILCTRMGLGKYAKLSRPTAINQDLRAIWLTPNICEKYFLYFYRTLNIVGSGVTVKGIKREDLLETLIPIPPIQEQNRIIRTIDSMIELCNKL
jgi:type I restriction enzyme S subunit